MRLAKKVRYIFGDHLYRLSEPVTEDHRDYKYVLASVDFDQVRLYLATEPEGRLLSGPRIAPTIEVGLLRLGFELAQTEP